MNVCDRSLECEVGESRRWLNWEGEEDLGMVGTTPGAMVVKRVLSWSRVHGVVGQLIMRLDCYVAVSRHG